MVATDTRKNRKRFYELERVFKGAANHRRLEVLRFLKDNPDCSTEEIVDELGINYQTAAEHLRRLLHAGLVTKYRSGNIMHYTLSPAGIEIINLWQKL